MILLKGYFALFNMFFSIYAKIQPACKKKWLVNALLKECQMTLYKPCGPKMLSKSLYLTPFPRSMHFSVLRRNSRWLPKMGGDINVDQKCQMTAYIAGAKNFAKIALICTVSKINTFLHFTQKFKMAAKNGRKFLAKKMADDSAYTPGVKNSVIIALSCSVSEINAS